MNVQVIGTEGCRCLGDAIRDLDSKGFIRGHFVLLGANSITNANLKALLEQHKKTAKFDKGAALTVIFKEGNTKFRTGDEVMIAMDVENNRLHFHQRLKIHSKEKKFEIPLEVFVNNSRVALYHNLLDPQIAICSPSLLSLFSDNFDFETRDDFIKGLLINEEILDSRIYVSVLEKNAYARKVGNWLSYQIVSNDIISRWVYPLVPDMGICSLKQNYSFLRNNIYKSANANVSKYQLKENVVIESGTNVDDKTTLSSSVVGKNCKIGKNCILHNVFLEDEITIEDDCKLQYCFVGQNTKIGCKSVLSDGVIIGKNVFLPEKTEKSKCLIQSEILDDEDIEKIGEKAYVINEFEAIQHSDSEDEELKPTKGCIPKMVKIPMLFEDSDYNSSSDGEDESGAVSPVLDDTNIFLSEVIDSLARGYTEQSNPDFLILEINSSRYAYNMTLKEVNYNVVKAIFSLTPIKEADATTVLSSVNLVFSRLGAVVSNYIKTNESMIDGLRALEECFNQQTSLKLKAANIIHYLYDKEYFSEDAILEWHNDLDEECGWLRNSLQKLVEWLNQTSEEESSEEDELQK
ncbi:translation initiation factor eIF-2B subunit epsilon isoform X2 [Condylostylus longicornis]|nr:translation initiation factor eIF-2B subunit epsilon isoform X2 [Condylostylus longicornis]